MDYRSPHENKQAVNNDQARVQYDEMKVHIAANKKKPRGALLCTMQLMHVVCVLQFDDICNHILALRRAQSGLNNADYWNTDADTMTIKIWYIVFKSSMSTAFGCTCFLIGRSVGYT